MKSLEERQAERAERKAAEAQARDVTGTGMNDPSTSDGSGGVKPKKAGKAAKAEGTEPPADPAINPAGGNGGGAPFPT